ncbi:hypothetical protein SARAHDANIELLE_42 [Hafnia phage vB_HpaM_SarahDanielle]|uniref:Uncharacterized protein n=1 Tax=Hafnia phage vB_HpaM_SarahDanielle TaxID=2836113 RepID=A0AAE7W9N7_9CAUD|nr:hypothetical protein SARAHDANIELLE_42 [Hafnia phage vB_HpaM_SarahDanielle]
MTTQNINSVSIDLSKKVKVLATPTAFEDVVMFETNKEGFGAYLKLSEFVKTVIILQAGDMDKDSIQEVFTSVDLKVFPLEEMKEDFKEIIQDAKDKGIWMQEVTFDALDLVDTFSNMEVGELLQELFA